MVNWRLSFFAFSKLLVSSHSSIDFRISLKYFSISSFILSFLSAVFFNKLENLPCRLAFSNKLQESAFKLVSLLKHFYLISTSCAVSLLFVQALRNQSF